MKRFLFSLMFASMLFGMSARAEIYQPLQYTYVGWCVASDVSVAQVAFAEMQIAITAEYNLLPISAAALLPEVSYDLRCFAPCKTLYAGLKADSKDKGFVDINYQKRYSY